MDDDQQIRLDDTFVPDTPHARRSDPFTSRRAAKKMEEKEGKTSRLKPNTDTHLTLKLIAERPLTGIEARRATGKDIWKRVSDLRLAGLVQPVAVRRDPKTKHQGRVMAITPRGARVLHELEQGHTVNLGGSDE